MRPKGKDFDLALDARIDTNRWLTLKGTVQHGRGLQWVEAYPPKDAKSPQGNYRGPLSMYLEAGFESHREGDRYLVVRKKL